MPTQILQIAFIQVKKLWTLLIILGSVFWLYPFNIPESPENLIPITGIAAANSPDSASFLWELIQ